MGVRGAHERRQPRGRYDLNLADIALGLIVEVLWVMAILAAVFTGR